MIQINSIFGYFVALVLLVTGLHVGIRTHYLLTPPSDIKSAKAMNWLRRWTRT